MVDGNKIVENLDTALEALDGLVTGVYDAMLEEEKDLWARAVFHMTKAKKLATKEDKAEGHVVDIFEGETNEG